MKSDAIVWTGSGEKRTITQQYKPFPGQVFFNQNIGTDKNWGNTLSREGLKSVQVSGIDTSTGEVRYRVFRVINGKLIEKPSGSVTPKVFNAKLLTGKF